MSVSRTVISGLLLDVDDTLMDTRAAMVAAGTAAVAELWPDAGAQVHHDAAVHFQGDPQGFFHRLTSGELGFAQMRRARVADLLEFFSLRAMDDVRRRFEDAYAPAFSANVRVFDDVVPLIGVVSAAGIPMGLLINSSSSYTRQKLEITGLASAFAAVTTRDTLGFGKPDARAFHHACRLLRSAPADTTYVGDDIEIDALAARDAGLSAVWLQREPGDSHGACRARARGILVIRSLSQVPALWARR